MNDPMKEPKPLLPLGARAHRVYDSDPPDGLRWGWHITGPDGLRFVMKDGAHHECAAELEELSDAAARRRRSGHVRSAGSSDDAPFIRRYRRRGS